MRARTTNLPVLATLAAGGLLMLHARRRRQAERYVDSLDAPVATAVLGLAALAAGGLLLANRRRGESSTVEETIELNVPISTAYNQWTQFEDFPKFMATVESVKQIDDTHLHWRAVVGGKLKEWDAEITEQIPDARIAWRSTGGVQNSGVVTFHPISESRTRVMLQMDYHPETVIEELADASGAVKLTTKGNLKRFKELLEGRGAETGAWRGAVPQH